MDLKLMGRGSGIAVIAWALAGCVTPGGDGEPDDGSGTTSEGETSPTRGDTDSNNDDGSGSEITSEGPPATCNEDELSNMYTQYIEPFVSGAVAQSCSQCHMTGIDISIYAQDTPCQTMACMVDMGAVDLQNPENSELLAQILLGDPNSSVFDVSDEHEAMLEWFQWSAQCHNEVCAEVESPCTSGTGAGSTGVNPIGDCSEDDLLAVFWDTVMVDRGRCLSCHSDWGQQEGTFGACQNVDECMDEQLCEEGFCRAPGPWLAPHMFEGVEGSLDWNDPAHRQLGLNTMYNMVALGHFDEGSPLDSLLLIKPLLEGFQPTQIHGPGVDITDVPENTGVGVFHGGSDKFNFGFQEPPIPESGVIDCRVEEPCGDGCSAGNTCMEGYCRMTGSYCDDTYPGYVRFLQYFAGCASADE